MSTEKRGEVNADFLFEVSWEVCNKVGGIYTVIKSKVRHTRRFYHDNYILIGPYFNEKAKGEFEELPVPENFRELHDELSEQGIIIHYGRWLTDGAPQVFLIDFQPFFKETDNIKKELWETFKIDSLNSSFEFNEPVIWSWAAGMIIEKFCDQNKNMKIAATFHEWIGGTGLLYLKRMGSPVGTTFVTHATVLGRCLANDGVDIYRTTGNTTLMESMDFDSEAHKRNVHPKHFLEKACAHNADIFATVSEITGMEAKAILKKSPDILVPNGLDLDKFPTFEDASIRHKSLKDKINHFLMYYFFPYYSFDMDKTMIYFTASRYEFRDKGIDITIKALGKLNESLKKENSDKTVVMFFWIPSSVRGIKQEIVENRTLFKDIHDSLKDDASRIMWQILSTVVSNKHLSDETILSEEFISEVKKKVLKFKRENSMPPCCTHDLSDPNDVITNELRKNGLKNREDDRVKVIFYPIYLTGADGLLDLTYYESILGSHLGIFPSFYEPWGYTPLESGALGVSSITSDLAGYGRYINSQKKKQGIGTFVLNRLNKNDDDVVDHLHELLYFFTMLTKNKRIENKMEARKIARLADWNVLIEKYIKAHNESLVRVNKSS